MSENIKSLTHYLFMAGKVFQQPVFQEIFLKREFKGDLMNLPEPLNLIHEHILSW